jgi:hypothetical protein
MPKAAATAHTGIEAGRGVSLETAIADARPFLLDHGADFVTVDVRQLDVEHDDGGFQLGHLLQGLGTVLRLHDLEPAGSQTARLGVSRDLPVVDVQDQC